MGGDTLTASVNLAKLLRERAEKKHFDSRIDKTVEALINNELNNYGDDFKKPKQSVRFTEGGDFVIDMNKQPSQKVVFGDLETMEQINEDRDDQSVKKKFSYSQFF